ncbi:MAG: phosphoribosylanthranilate isomerase [Caldilineaceae bacterium]|nr:phosphoribosylanthranilate isomerase [Caldilineaceae bacterium]
MTTPVQVKICGITNVDDALVAVDAGADLLGFILYPKSPRYVTPPQIAVIIAAVRTQVPDDAAGPRCAGVFVNATAAEIRAIIAQTGLDLAQLHGDEPAALLDELAGRAYKALRPADAAQAVREAAVYARAGTPGLLVDAYDPAEYGGTGKKADWHAAAALAAQHPGLLLAGGLTPDNVAAAVQTVQPWGVDVASGVEAAPGRKDHAKVRAFVAAAKAAQMA